MGNHELQLAVAGTDRRVVVCDTVAEVIVVVAVVVVVVVFAPGESCGYDVVVAVTFAVVGRNVVESVAGKLHMKSGPTSVTVALVALVVLVVLAALVVLVEPAVAGNVAAVVVEHRQVVVDTWPYAFCFSR